MSSREQQICQALFKQFADHPRFTLSTIPFMGDTFETPDVLSVLYQIKSILTEDTYAFDSTDEHPVIYDCGANVGISCVYFARRFPSARIVAFEADPNIYAYLLKNLECNKIPSVEARNQAVWIENGTVQFALEGADGGSICGPGPMQEVPCVRLSDLLEQEQHVAMLKIDIEGSETDVLLDCEPQLSKVDRIFVEYHSWSGAPQTLNVILDILTRCGFRYYLETICNRQTPFLDPSPQREKDYQTEIFAWKQR